MLNLNIVNSNRIKASAIPEDHVPHASDRSTITALIAYQGQLLAKFDLLFSHIEEHFGLEALEELQYNLEVEK